jgi:hypothetical protein
MMWILGFVILGVILHEVAGRYISGYRTVVANMGYAMSAMFLWVTSTDWSAIVKDPTDIFMVISAQSFLTIYQQIRSDRERV